MRIPTLVVALSLSVASRAHAQITERPIPFDSARRVTVVTESLVERLHLAAPAWPVTDSFKEARLYAIAPGGGYVLVVPRPAGTIDRYALTDDERVRLRDAIDAALAANGRVSPEPGSDVISEPAGNAFARRQTLLGAFVYGPLAASLVTDGSAAGALYLLTTGGTFFASYAASQNITRAQNHLAGHLGLGAGAAGYLFGYSAGGNPDDKGLRALALGSALGGTIAGVNLGRTMSEAEAHGATAGMESAALLSLTGAGAIGAHGRGLAAASALGIVSGYPIGLAYARHASYAVTAGDADAVGTAGIIGAMYGGALLGQNYDRRVGFAVFGATYLAGLVAGDLAIARGYDLTQSESNIAGVGAIAGALMGAAIPTLAGYHDLRALLGTGALGATIGMAALVASSPHSVSAGAAAPRQGSSGRGSRFQVDFQPTAALGAVSRRPGRYSLVHIGF